ncbi:hypothetical protein JCM5350_004788 [Sporobolomyces pararoseus]
MDCLKAVQTYLDKILTNTKGIKVLLLDQDTTPIISLVSTQSKLLQHEIYLTDRIDNPSRRQGGGGGAYPPTTTGGGGGERLPHLNCIVLLRPTEESIEACERELEQGRYGGYWLYFTNTLTKLQIERLAEADRFELVQEVQEYFLDYSPLTSSHFTFSILPTPLHPSPTCRTYSLYGTTPQEWSSNSPSYHLHLTSLKSLLLSLKKKPIVRYERMSPMAKRLGKDLVDLMNNNTGGEAGEGGLFDFRRSEKSPILILLDRRNDPVTPLLTQWTYQGMVHEELGIENGRVSLSNAVPPVGEELKELVLPTDGEQDGFYKKTMYDNFGDLGAHLSRYVEEYSKTSTKSKQKLETVEEMKKFIEDYPEFKKLGSNVSKHVALVGELSRLVEERKLLQVSELEQSLAANESHSQDLRAVQAAIESSGNEEIPKSAKLRLAILYALRYQKLPGNQINSIVELLRRQGVEDAEMVNIMLGFAGAEQRQDDLFSNENFFSRGKSALKGLKGVENVYTQHKPHLAETLDLLLRGRLKETSYPFVEGQQGHGTTSSNSPYNNNNASSGTNSSNQGIGGGSAIGGGGGGGGGFHSRPQDIILFMIGGTTYEEARYVALLNKQFESGQGLSSGTVGPSSASSANGGDGGGIGIGTRILLGGTCVLNSKMFLQMVRDASFSFPAPQYTSATSNLAPISSSSSSTSQNYSQPPLPPPTREGGNYALNLGPVSLNVDQRVGNTLEAATDAARDGLKDLFGKVKSRVDGVRLN